MVYQFEAVTLPNDGSDGGYRPGGYWVASIAVKPSQRRHKVATANGDSMDAAQANLLALVNNIPVHPWE